MALAPDTQQQLIGASAGLTGLGIGFLIQRPSLLMVFFTVIMGAITFSLLNQ